MTYQITTQIMPNEAYLFHPSNVLSESQTATKDQQLECIRVLTKFAEDVAFHGKQARDDDATHFARRSGLQHDDAQLVLRRIETIKQSVQH